jgi:hypothetical protein
MELSYERTSKVFLSVFEGMLAECKSLLSENRKSMFVGVLFFKVFCIILFPHYTHWVSRKKKGKKIKIMLILIPKGYLLGIMKKKKRKKKETNHVNLDAQ